MKSLKLILILVCAVHYCTAQTNFVKNPDLEQYSECPDGLNLINRALYWSAILDSSSEIGMEYYNACGNKFSDGSRHVPLNTAFFQYPHSDSGMGGFHLYNDKSYAPPSPLPFDYRDYLQGRLFAPLVAGKTYCVSFWVNAAETSAYGQNKIGAYLDNGAINKLPLPPGSEVTSVVPQVYTLDKIIDTANWTKIEGSFVANGTETHITIGNFFPNSAVDTISGIGWIAIYQYSYYLIDDVSVVAIDAKANAGADNWVAIGNTVDIGPIADSTARGMDCKWYHKGSLIDSGNVITVNAASIINQIDTYIVVQTVCGYVTRDTMLLKTTSLNIPLLGGARGGFIVYPNPSNGTFVITNHHAVIPTKEGTIHAIVYDLLGRAVHKQGLSFNNKEATLKLNLPSATYILELSDEEGMVQRERVVLR